MVTVIFDDMMKQGVDFWCFITDRVELRRTET